MIDLPTTVDVPLRRDEQGLICVAQSHITLLSLVTRYKAGASPETIHQELPTISVADIYAVIAYYLAHREAVDAHFHQIETSAERQRQARQRKDPMTAAFNAKMRSLLAKADQKNGH